MTIPALLQKDIVEIAAQMVGIKDLKSRFKKYVSKTDHCWKYTGPVTKHGYGQMMVKYKSLRSHRISWFLSGKKFKSGLVLDHICRNRLCVNPKHLRQVSIKENVLCGEGICAKHGQKTHCKRGHLFDKENTLNYYADDESGTDNCYPARSSLDKINGQEE